MLTLHIVCQPFLKRVHNVIDALLIVNLLLINNIAFFKFYRRNILVSIRRLPKDVDALALHVLQLVLLYLPIVTAGVYLLIVICKKGINSGCLCAVLRKLSISIPPSVSSIRELMAAVKKRSASCSSEEHPELSLDNLIEDRLIDDDSAAFAGTGEYFSAELDNTKSYP